MKAQLKERRLKEYEAKMFNVEMDIVALEAVGDEATLKQAKKDLEDLQKAYKAVESMKI